MEPLPKTRLDRFRVRWVWAEAYFSSCLMLFLKLFSTRFILQKQAICWFSHIIHVNIIHSINISVHNIIASQQGTKCYTHNRSLSISLEKHKGLNLLLPQASALPGRLSIPGQRDMIPFGWVSTTELQNDGGQLGRVHLMCDMRSCGQDQTHFQEQVLLHCGV